MMLYGASGHAKVIIDLLEDSGIKISGIFDDDLNKRIHQGYKVFGPYDKDLFPDDSIVISIGDNALRKKISGTLIHKAASVVSINAVVSKTVIIGEGTVIFHNSVVQPDTILGKHSIINTSASVDHDNKLGDFCHIAPNATLCGGVNIGEGTLIGAGSTILPNINIGKWAIIGAGSVVTEAIPDNCIAVGNPARIIRKTK